jgi:phospholipid transport system substrate-binding protein
MAAEYPTPTTVTDRLHETLVEVMRNADKLGYTGRYEELEPVIADSFDFKVIGRAVLGRYWNKLDEKQKLKFLDTFSKLSTATYASQFDSYSGETFRNVAEEEKSSGRMLVKTELVNEDGESVSFSYWVHSREGKWLIINVVADGVSDLALKRADYTAVMQERGFDALLGKLNNKIQEYETSKSGQ